MDWDLSVSICTDAPDRLVFPFHPSEMKI
jgi:hypothetical protein